MIVNQGCSEERHKPEEKIGLTWTRQGKSKAARAITLLHRKVSEVRNLNWPSEVQKRKTSMSHETGENWLARHTKGRPKQQVSSFGGNEILCR